MMIKLFVLALSATLCFANPDDSKRVTGPNIHRHCEDKDYECIRNLFCHNIKDCRVRDNDAEVPKSYKIPETITEQSYYNLTIVDKRTEVKGLNKCFISEFYFNRKTEDQVISLTCHNITTTFERSAYQHRQSMEGEVYHYNILFNFEEITFTTVLRKSCGWNLCRAHTASYFEQPKFEVKTTDKKVHEFVNSHVDPPGVFHKAILLKLGRNMFRKYINSFICDFGCK